MPAAAEVADRLGVPLDVMVVRTIRCPSQPELGIGAIAEGGVRVLNDALVEKVGIEPIELEGATARKREELARRVRRYRGERAPVAVEVVVVDTRPWFFSIAEFYEDFAQISNEEVVSLRERAAARSEGIAAVLGRG